MACSRPSLALSVRELSHELNNEVWEKRGRRHLNTRKYPVGIGLLILSVAGCLCGSSIDRMRRRWGAQCLLKVQSVGLTSVAQRAVLVIAGCVKCTRAGER